MKEFHVLNKDVQKSYTEQVKSKIESQVQNKVIWKYLNSITKSL